MDQHQPERRRDVRTRISIPTYVVRRGSQEAAEMVDASYRGLFLQMDAPPPVREMIKLRIQLPNREIEMHGVVVRIVEDRKGRAGVGLRFFALNGADRADWEKFITAQLHLESRTRAA